MSTTTAPTILKRLFGPVQELPAGAPALTLRFAGPADTDAIDRLAQLDSRRSPRGPVLVAEVGGELWAAMSLDDRHAVADPFRHDRRARRPPGRARPPAAPRLTRPHADAAARVAEGRLRPSRVELMRYRTRRPARIPADSCPRRVHQSLYFPDLSLQVASASSPGRVSRMRNVLPTRLPSRSTRRAAMSCASSPRL